MSALAARLGRRTITVEDGRHGGLMPLSGLRTGESATVRGFAASLPTAHSRRLFDLGFAPGAAITVIRRAPTLDPVIYRVADCEVALRRALAAGVVVDRQ